MISPFSCWKGYERVPGTKKGAKGSCRKASPTKKTGTKGGGTKKVCLPKAKISSMSQSERQAVVSAKQKADQKDFKDAETKARASYKSGDK